MALQTLNDGKVMDVDQIFAMETELTLLSSVLAASHVVVTIIMMSAHGVHGRSGAGCA